jgi:hypothetical protein
MRSGAARPPSRRRRAFIDREQTVAKRIGRMIFAGNEIFTSGCVCCGATILLGWALRCNSEGRMAATWKTKWGVRRVRRDTPTIEEALIAAESLANDPGQRAEIAASLMGVPVDEVRVLAAKQAAKTRGRASLVAGRTRAVVVEYKRPRMGRGPISFASKR